MQLSVFDKSLEKATKQKSDEQQPAKLDKEKRADGKTETENKDNCDKSPENLL